jgi:hypothetical protein
VHGDLTDPGAPSSPDVDPLQAAIEELAGEHAIKATIHDRVIRLTDEVSGSPHHLCLEALGVAAAATPVAATAHGPAGAVAAVWSAPDLYIARWTPGNRWVAAYRFPPRGKPDDYLREESGIPSRFGKGNWYKDVPEEVEEAFLTVGLLLDEPPFPVADPPPPRPIAEPVAKRASSRSTTPRAPAAPRAPRKRAAAPVKKAAPPTTRTCPMCNLQKHLSQFIPDSDYCVDCR